MLHSTCPADNPELSRRCCHTSSDLARPIERAGTARRLPAHAPPAPADTHPSPHGGVPPCCLALGQDSDPLHACFILLSSAQNKKTAFRLPPGAEVANRAPLRASVRPVVCRSLSWLTGSRLPAPQERLDARLSKPWRSVTSRHRKLSPSHPAARRVRKSRLARRRC